MYLPRVLERMPRNRDIAVSGNQSRRDLYLGIEYGRALHLGEMPDVIMGEVDIFFQLLRHLAQSCPAFPEHGTRHPVARFCQLS